MIGDVVATPDRLWEGSPNWDKDLRTLPTPQRESGAESWKSATDAHRTTSWDPNVYDHRPRPSPSDAPERYSRSRKSTCSRDTAGTRTPRQRQPASDDGCTTALRGSHQGACQPETIYEKTWVKYLQRLDWERDPANRPPWDRVGGYRRPRGLEADARSDLGPRCSAGREGDTSSLGRPPSQSRL